MQQCLMHERPVQCEVLGSEALQCMRHAHGYHCMEHSNMVG